MKKKTLLYSLLLLGSTSFISCTDMLEKEPLDKFTNNPLFWNNPSSVEGYAASFYNLFTGYGNGGGSGDYYFKYLSDDQIGASYQNWKFVNVPAESADWADTWDEIRRANAMIEALNSPSTTMEETTKKHWLGVARLMRAWQYWDLVRKFGDCPWLDHVPDIDDPVLYAERTDRDEIMDYVYEDLEFACNNVLDEKSQTTWSRDLAYAMTSHIALWEGTYRKYRSEADHQKAADLDGAKRFLDLCVKACEQIMPDYSLCESYQSIYNSETLAGNPEVIFYKEYKKDLFGHSLINFTCMSTPISGMTKDAFDSYLFLDGKTKANTTYDNSEAGVLKVSTTDMKEHLNIKALLDVRDKRLAATIDSIVCYSKREWPRLNGGSAMVSSSGYTVSKYDNVNIESTYRVTGGKNYTSAPLYWLSVIYLNFAEAKAELADMGQGSITDEDLNNSINKLKQRAGLPIIKTTVEDMGDNDMNVSPLIFEIRRERRCELMFDNDFRYWDLIRWHQLDKLDSSVNKDITFGANVANDPEAASNPDITVKDGYIDGYMGRTRTYEYKHYWYPIPSGQINLNKNLGQNPGWEE